MKPRLLEVLQLGNPVLRQIATKAVVDSIETQQLANDLLYTCRHVKGMGIAAPQVGKLLRVIVVASKPNERYPNAPKMEPTVMINPTILGRSARTQKDYEGCLSIPGIRALVPRYTWIQVSCRSLGGGCNSERFHGFIARIIQHEIDHLDGIVFLDRTDSHDVVTDKEYFRIMTKRNKKK